MTDYVQVTNFTAKDALTTGDPNKKALGAHVDAELSLISTAVASKLNSSSYTAADVLTKLLTVDGAGSGIDADLLDGNSSAAFATASHTHANADLTQYTAADVLTKLLTVDGSGSGLDADLLDGSSSAAFATASHSHANGDLSGYTAADVLSKLLTVDGAGSGLDADLLDGNSSAAFLLASSYTAADVLTKLLTVDGSGSGLDADLLDGNSSAAFALAATTISVSGTGLSGGGSLAANRTITIDQTAMATRNITGKTGIAKTLSTSAASGGADGDIWYRY